jgi:hypothetical protein
VLRIAPFIEIDASVDFDRAGRQRGADEERSQYASGQVADTSR